MGTYCSVRDVRLALTPSALPDDEGQTGTELPDWQIEDAIEEAEGTINAVLLSRYVITPFEIEVVNPENPLETWVFMVAPSPVRGWTRDIAAYLVALTFRKNRDLAEDDPIRLRWLMVKGLLDDVRDGKLRLDLPIPSEPLTDQGVHVVNLYDGKLFDLSDVGLEYDGQSRQRLLSLRTDV